MNILELITIPGDKVKALALALSSLLKKTPPVRPKLIRLESVVFAYPNSIFISPAE